MPNQDTIISMGWSMIYLTAFNIIVNFSIILKAGFRGIWLIIVKWYRRFRRLLNPDFMKPKPKLNKYEELCKINETGSPAPTITTVKGSTSTKKVKFVP